MIVIDQEGVFAPARLAGELREAGVDVAGVTCTEDGDGNVVAVQIIVDGDEAPIETIDKVCAAHEPADVEPAKKHVSVESQLAGALEALPDGPVSKKDLADVIATLRGNTDA